MNVMHKESKMICRINSAIGLSMVIGACLLGGCPLFAGDASKVLGSFDVVFRVSANGKAEKIFSPKDSRFTAVSPDGRYVVYSACEDKECFIESFWLHDLKSGKELKIAEPPSLQYVIWSPDSKEIMIRRRYPNDNMNVGSYSIFNMESHTARLIEFPEQFVGWISKDKFLLYGGDFFINRKIFSYDLNTKEKRLITPAEGIDPQYVLEDQKAIVANHWIKKNENGSEYECEGVRVGLAKGDMEKITPVLKECPIQLLYSPSGKSLAYIESDERRHSATGIAGALMIDGKPLRGIDESIRGFAWLDEDTIVVETTYKHTVWNVKSQKVLGVTKIYDDIP